LHIKSKFNDYKRTSEAGFLTFSIPKSEAIAKIAAAVCFYTILSSSTKRLIICFEESLTFYLVLDKDSTQFYGPYNEELII